MINPESFHRTFIFQPEYIMQLLKKTSLSIHLLITMLSLGTLATSSHLCAQVVNQQYSNPAWAPAYVPGVRYYYLPDIETYYDLSNQDFVYLDNGQWLFSSTLPPVYGSYDLYKGFTIALDADVYEPWMHNQYYVSHYPRYYYRTLYHVNDQVRIRGFNENDAKPLYQDQQEASNGPDERQDTREHSETRPPQKVGYYGKDIGRPVKVQPHMRENKLKTSTPSQDKTQQENKDVEENTDIR